MNKCVLPFIEYDFAVGKPCCMLSNYDHKKDFHTLLADHTANIKSTYCKSCWHHEKIGQKSKRLSHNESFPQYLNLEKPILKSVVVSTGNICNLYCVTCGVGNSTGWNPKHKFMNPQTNENKIQPTNAFTSKKNLDNIDWSEIENVEFLGGETLYSKDLWILIKKLKKDTKISLLTNGTIKLDQVKLDIIKEYKHMHITFSLDGIDKIFEYLRQPAKWPQVKENIENYKESLGINNLGINLTISNMNIFYIDRIFLELSKIISKKHSYFFVEKPEVFAVSNLPPEVGKIIEDKNPYFFSKNKIAWTGNEESMKKFLENVNLQDQFSNRFFKDYLPELYQLIQGKMY
jgi:organic radical activating enzyme